MPPKDDGHLKAFCVEMLMVLFAVSLSGCLTEELPKAVFLKNQQEKPLEWTQVVTEAIDHHPDLEAAAYGIRSSARARDIALGNYLPVASGEFNRDRLRTPANSSKDNLALDLVIDQPLFTGFDTTGKFLKSKKDLEVSKWEYRDVSAHVRFRLRSDFIELLRVKKLLGVLQRIEGRRKENSDMIQLRYEAGREHLGSAMRAKAIAGQAAFEVHQTLRRAESQSIRLEREMGGGFELPLEVAGDLEQMVPEMPSGEPDFAALAGEVPRVKTALKTAESLKAAMISAQASVWPKVDGTADYGYSGEKASSLEEESLLGLKVSVPFFSGGKNIGAIRKAKADYEQARQTARSIRDEVITLLAEAWAQYMDAIEAVEVRRKFVAASRKRSEIVRAEYEAGLVNFQDFDITEQDIADSEKNYVEALAAVLVQRANWEFAQGSTLEDALHER